ncbi:hypothetical protein D0A22_18000 [Stutzerimonas stutzeri]|nr:hypothetical protein D0A22_18000 [Stutzerimonas stutzeri]
MPYKFFWLQLREARKYILAQAFPSALTCHNFVKLTKITAVNHRRIYIFITIINNYDLTCEFLKTLP